MVQDVCHTLPICIGFILVKELLGPPIAHGAGSVFWQTGGFSQTIRLWTSHWGVCTALAWALTGSVIAFWPAAVAGRGGGGVGDGQTFRFRSVARSMSDAAPLLSSGDDAPEDKYNLTYICFLVLGFGMDSTHAIYGGTFCILCARVRASKFEFFSLTPIVSVFHGLHLPFTGCVLPSSGSAAVQAACSVCRDCLCTNFSCADSLAPLL